MYAVPEGELGELRVCFDSHPICHHVGLRVSGPIDPFFEPLEPLMGL